MRFFEVLVQGQLAAAAGIRSLVRRLKTADDRGASALEYAVLVGLILAIVIAGIRFLGTRATTMLDSASTALS